MLADETRRNETNLVIFTTSWFSHFSQITPKIGQNCFTELFELPVTGIRLVERFATATHTIAYDFPRISVSLPLSRK